MPCSAFYQKPTFELVSAILLVLLSSVAAATPNEYTIENTFAKQVKHYPFIKMGSGIPSNSVYVDKNITYKRVDGESLGLDVYIPRKPQVELLQAIVLVHGGGWWQGYRDNLAPLAIKLAERGIVAVTVSYRLAGRAKYPAAVHDVRDVLDWLYDHAGDYNIDVARISVGGSSAGGQIAALTGLTFGDAILDIHPESDGRLQRIYTIVNLDGLSDFTTPMALKFENDPAKKPSSAERWFGGRYEDKRVLWHQASPINYVGKNSPPILFLNSSKERFGVGRDEYIDKFIGMGGCASTYQFEKSPHTYWLFEPWLTPAADIVAAFLLGDGLEKLEHKFAVHCD